MEIAMRRRSRYIAVVLGLVVVGYQLGTSYAQRYMSKEPFPRKLASDPQADVDLWKLLDSDDVFFWRDPENRYDVKWRQKLKDDLVRSTPNSRSVARERRDAAR